MKRQIWIIFALTLTWVLTAGGSNVLSRSLLDDDWTGDIADSASQDLVSVRSIQSGNAQIIPAASCSQTDIQAAIDTANEGDFVRVPAGHCTWTTPGDNQPSVRIYQKGITLWGAGIDQTVITDGTTAEWNETPIRVDGLAGKPFRITGFTFIGNGVNDSFPTIMVSGDSKSWRIDHIEFEDAKRAISTSGQTYGVIDHCTFSNHSYDINYQAINISSNDAVWQLPLALGTTEAVYIEDNLFDYSRFGNTVDGHIGARFVFRHNTLNGTYIEAHGFCCNLSRGTFSYEIYENTITGTSGNWVPFSLRGGTGVVFDNTVNGTFGLPQVQVYNDRSCPDRPWQGVCDGTSPVDGNQESNGYPCRDQIGRSTDLPEGQQTLEPLYEWGNFYNGADMDIVLNPGMCAQMADHIQENRDFYNDLTRPGYTPYVYPHPLTQELVLTGIPADQMIHLTWEVRTILPVSATWQIDYLGPTGDEPSPITGIPNETRAYALTGLTNYEWYTITLSATVSETVVLSDTVNLMPTDQQLYLPLTARASSP